MAKTPAAISSASAMKQQKKSFILLSISCFFVLLISVGPSSLNSALADRYIESIAANVDHRHHPADSDTNAVNANKPTATVAAAAAQARKHENFLPLVAFQCGYRNKFLNKRGEWQDDPSSVASCLHGRYDILKYCRRVYPGKEITNIVDYSHFTRIDNWCKEDRSDCHSKFTVRPYRCLIGDFVTESLQVPNKCHFSHVAGKNQCNDYKSWNTEAENQCAKKLEEGTGKPTRLHSFAMLEPCGIDMFRGVEYVCCPKSVEEKLVDLDKDVHVLDEDDEDDYSDDEDEEDDEDETATQKSTTTKVAQDPYFKDDQASNEHERFRDAVERLERKHRKRVTKVITQWSELFERYNKMKETDQKGAEDYKREMTAKFRKTVAALEDENKEQRKQLEEVHNERVQAALNEKKRGATHSYRSALAKHVGTENREDVLRTLKAYIKAEEKDRTHMLNRYRHLLRTEPEAAVQFEPVLLHRLRYIDLRINGTLAMLRDFPSLEKEIRPTAEKFWKDYRHENTPEGAELTDSAAYAGLSEDERNERLIAFYKKTFERDQNEPELSSFVEPKDEKTTLIKQHLSSVKTTQAPITTTTKRATTTTKKKSVVVALKDVLAEREDNSDDDGEEEDSDEDQFEDEEGGVGTTLKKKQLPSTSSGQPRTAAADNTDLHVEFLKGIDDEKKQQHPSSSSSSINKPAEKQPLMTKVPIKTKAQKAIVDNDDDESSSDEESDEDNSGDAEGQYVESNDKKASDSDSSDERELHIAVEPIMLASDEEELRERVFLRKWITQSNIIIGCMVLSMLLLWLTIRRRNRHRGFIEVEIHNPEEKRVAAMQATGYENPTYTFYETKP